MKNIIYIYKVMLKYWISFLWGTICLLGYAVFSGISVMMAIPLLDYVFKTPDRIIKYNELVPFLKAVGSVFSQYFTTHGFSINKESLSPYLNQLKDVLSHSDPNMLLWIIGISVLLMIFFKNLFFFGRNVFFATLRGKTIRDIRNKMFEKYLYQSLMYLNKNKVGDSLVRMVSDIQIVSNFFINSFFDLFQSLLLLFVYLRIALFLNLKLFLITLLIVPLFGILISYIGNKIKKYAKRIQKQSSKMFSNVEEVLNGIKIVKLFSREQYELKKFKDINNKHYKFWKKSSIYNAFNVPISELNGTLIGIIILIVGGKEVLNPNISFSFGAFTSFLLAVFSALHPLKVITRTYTGIRKAMVSVNRIFEVLNAKNQITEPENSIAKKDFNNDIQLKNVTFSYGNKPVLKDLNLILKKGEKVAIVGKSGSGKTTLINLLTRMFDPTEGEIKIDGINLKDIKISDLRSLFGVVTQEPILFNLKIEDNIKYGTLKDVTLDDVKKAAKIAYADEFIEKFPKKYSHILDNKAVNISGGQKQRLCIARAIVGNPPILVFDEATSSLDTESEKRVQEALEEAQKNRTVIVIAHRLSTILSSDKILVMENGKIICTGKNEELLKNCPEYQNLYNLQFDVKKEK